MLAMGLVYASVASVYDQFDTAALEALNRSGFDEVVMTRRITVMEFKEVPVGTVRAGHEDGYWTRWSTRRGPRARSQRGASACLSRRSVSARPADLQYIAIKKEEFGAWPICKVLTGAGVKIALSS